MRNKLIIAGIAIVAVLGVGVLGKTLILNKPSKSPQDLVRTYIDNINEDKREDNEKYVTDDFIKKTEEENDGEESSDDTKLVTTFKEERIDGSKATVVHEVDAGIIKMSIEFKLVKEGNWLKGYSWKIDDVIVPTFGDDEETDPEDINWLDAQIGDEVELATVKYTVLESTEKSVLEPDPNDPLSEYTDPLNPAEGSKFVVIKFKVENTTKDAISLSSSDLFTLMDSDENKYQEYDGSLYDYFEDTLIYHEINPRASFTGYTVFEIPDDVEDYGVVSCKKDSSDCYLVDLK